MSTPARPRKLDFIRNAWLVMFGNQSYNSMQLTRLRTEEKPHGIRSDSTERVTTKTQASDL